MKTDWMDSTTFSCYEQVKTALAKAKAEHRRLMPKLRNRTATREDRNRVKEVIQTINQLESKKQEILSRNPARPESLLKAITKREGQCGARQR